jgi:alpha-L-fucosidase
MKPVPQPEPTDGDTTWFTEARFGLFIHWGLYALGARHEWLKSMEQISDADYEKYFEHFDPDLYDPEAWADAAKAAGMKYFVVTTKHHEGFCLWDSALTDYKATRAPAGRDLLRPMVDAFRSRGLRVGFYHSLLDWHHPDYTLDRHHPQRETADPAAFDAGRELSRYADYLHGQTRELLTQFGQIDILWYDFSPAATDRFAGKGKEVWRSEELIRLVRSLQPKIILNDRLEIDQDVKTPEQFQPPAWVTVGGNPVVWEACQTFSGSWGYHRDESSWKSVGQLIRMLIDSVSKGGNLLLNVGPTGRGEFDWRAMERLRGIGRWMHYNSRSIYGCTQAPSFGSDSGAPTDVRYTWNPTTRRLYVHLFAYPMRHLMLPGLKSKVRYAQFLHDASELKVLDVVPEFLYGAGIEVEQAAETLILELPIPGPHETGFFGRDANDSIPVIELFLAE